MISNIKKIETFQTKLNNEHSELEGIVYSEAISLLNDDVNPDKVQNWVDKVLCSYTNKPKPLSEKEKKKNTDKQAKKLEKQLLFENLNNRMSDLLNEYGVLIIGFFDWKEISESEYDLIEKFVKDKGYYIKDLGDGAIEPYISRSEIDDYFIAEYDRIDGDLLDFSKKNILDDYLTMDISKFRNKIGELI